MEFQSPSKLYILLCLSALLLSSFHAQAVSVKYCDRKQDYVVKVAGVDILPYPVVRGKPATFKISAATGEAISGGKLIIDVSYFGLHVHSETRGLCEEVSCPVAAGNFVISHTQTLPSFTPPVSLYNNGLHYLETMRRQGQYVDPPANSYVATQMHHMADQRLEPKSGNFEEQLEAFTPERENPYANSKLDGQWRWEIDGSNMSNSMAFYNEAHFMIFLYASFFQFTMNGKYCLSGQGGDAARTQAHKEDNDVVYQVNNLSQTFEGLEQKFLDDILKLAKEQNDAEDAEIARHREKINAINAQYEEKLAALRARHATSRGEFLQRESQARQHQYQQTIRDPHPRSGMPAGDPHPRSGMPLSDPHGYGSAIASAAIGEVQRGYTANHLDRYSERARFLGGGGGGGGGSARVRYINNRAYFYC
ncbi:uncharacterized protein G2W53_037927 [Senna tora]|uniref:MD-2-related lipid-recognition domain-containing protein n=1 Tax=Senna tora TaxID=362788 RepID=A0A834SLZ9_9FABA|nr:uncharacterized protein G2W53_037927 [Senna tora]